MVHPEFGDARVLALLSPQSLAHFDVWRVDLPRIFPRIDLVSPRDLGHLHELVRQSGNEYQLILGVGGDGTLFQTLQYIDLDRQTLGIVPSGTGNDFATAIGFPKDLRSRLQRLAHAAAVPTDLAFANGKRYLNSAGIGIDTETLLLRERAGAFMKKQYNLMFLRVLYGMRPLATAVSWTDADGNISSERGRFFWLLSMNSREIGGGTKVAPQASLEDGLLDLIGIRAVSKLEVLRRMPDAIAGRHLGKPLTLFSQATSIRFDFEHAVPWLALDGELIRCDRKSVEFTAQARALRFLR